jgi:DNA-binding TFAR19-related protein (PDSD5 family)
MLQKKAVVTEIRDPKARERLERLYARRSAIDSLIRSLEEYDRSRPKLQTDGAAGASHSAPYFDISA